MSWALVLCAPLMGTLALVATAQQPPAATPAQWAAFAYLGVVSTFLGFFAWYRGLAIGPMSRVSQVQLVQPVLSLGWAALLLGERLTWATLGGGLVVVLCAGVAVRARQHRPAPVRVVAGDRRDLATGGSPGPLPALPWGSRRSPAPPRPR